MFRKEKCAILIGSRQDLLPNSYRAGDWHYRAFPNLKWWKTVQRLRVGTISLVLVNTVRTHGNPKCSVLYSF